MNGLDAAIALSAVGSFVGGRRAGLVVRAASWVGGIGGLVLAARNTDVLGRMLHVGDGSGRIGALALGLFGAIAVGRLAGGIGGRWLRRRLPSPVRSLDRTLGAAIGLLGVVGSVWLATPVLRHLPGWPSRSVAGSSLVRVIEGALPAAPDPAANLEELVRGAVTPVGVPGVPSIPAPTSAPDGR